MKIFFIIPYPLGVVPSQRFRFEHYLAYLEENKIQYSVSSFLDLKAWGNLYKKGHLISKTLGTLRGFFRRLGNLFSLRKYDYIFIHREASPLGPAWFEWFAAKLFRKKIIYDFDDAIWIPSTAKNNQFIKGFKNFGKVKRICRWSHMVVTGNKFLNEFAKKYNKNSIVIPTVVDTENVHSRLKDQLNGAVNIGWTGTFSTLKFIDQVVPVIEEIQKEYKVNFIVIADKDPQLKLPFYKFIKWTKETEIDDLLNFNIGIMPLEDTELAKGKCGFKAIQYMALGIPALVSPVGVNTAIVDDGINGFICDDAAKWKHSLKELLGSAEKRVVMGKLARQKIEKNYSVRATQDRFLELFRA